MFQAHYNQIPSPQSIKEWGSSAVRCCYPYEKSLHCSYFGTIWAVSRGPGEACRSSTVSSRCPEASGNTSIDNLYLS